MADLLKCPFCGGGASIVSTEPRLYRPSRNGRYAVACYNCEIYLGYDEDYGCQFDTEEEAIKAWNTRKPMEAVVAKLEKKSEEYNEKADRYSVHEDYFMRYLSIAKGIDTAISIVRGKE